MHVLVAASVTADKDGGSSISGLLFPLILILVIVYFFSMQRRRAKAQQQQMSRIVPGTLVTTTAGLYATVVELEDGDVLLEVAPDVVCRFSRSAIARVISTPDGAGDGGESSGEPQSHDDGSDGPGGPGGAEASPPGGGVSGGDGGTGGETTHPPRKEL
ncbi:MULTISPECIES: preprotein translocase subunit YajC [unclassified Frankia]